MFAVIRNPYFLIVGAGLVWGGAFTLVRIATADATHPVVLTALQVVISTLLFGLVCRGSGIGFWQRQHLRHYGVLALVGIIIPSLLYYHAAPHLSAGILSITVSSVPMLTYALMWLLRLEPFIFRRMVGIALGMVAVCLLILPTHELQSNDASFWTLVVLLSAFCYAIEGVYVSDGVEQTADVRQLLFGANLIATIVLVPLGIWYGADLPLSWFNSDAAWAVVSLAVVSTVAYMMFFYAIRIAGPVFSSQCAYVITITGVLWGIAILGEQHSLWVWVSVAIMMLGLFMVNPRQAMETLNKSS